MSYEITKFAIKALDLAVEQMDKFKALYEKALKTIKADQEAFYRHGVVIEDQEKAIAAGAEELKKATGEYSKLLRRITTIKDKIFPIWSKWTSNQNTRISEVLSTKLVADLAEQFIDTQKSEQRLIQQSYDLAAKLRPFWLRLKLSEGLGDAALSVMIAHFVTFFTAHGVSAPVSVVTFDTTDGVTLHSRLKEKIRAFTNTSGIPTLDNDNIEYMLDQLISYTRAQDDLRRGISGEIKAACGQICGSGAPTAHGGCPCVDFIAKRGPESEIPLDKELVADYVEKLKASGDGDPETGHADHSLQAALDSARITLGVVKSDSNRYKSEVKRLDVLVGTYDDKLKRLQSSYPAALRALKNMITYNGCGKCNISDYCKGGLTRGSDECIDRHIKHATPAIPSPGPIVDDKETKDNG